MAKQSDLDRVYMNMAKEISGLSYAKRKKVGCVLVTPDNVMLSSYNGQPRGWDNNCEHEIDGELVTKPSVIHAELNAILHAARQGVSVKNSTIYITMSPCESCSALISQSGIKRVVYLEAYRNLNGVAQLKNHGVIVECLEG